MVQNDIYELRQNFDAMYIGAIPQLLAEDGAFLAFLATLTGTEALAGFFAPEQGSGQRFVRFIEMFFPDGYAPHVNAMWNFRNMMVHSFNPGPFTLTYHQSRLHLTVQNGQVTLNAEDFYSALVTASRRYFELVTHDAALQAAFMKRLNEKEGGGVQSFVVEQIKVSSGAA